METGLREAYVEMLPRLQAEDALRTHDVMTAASPFAKKHSRDEWVRGKRRLAGGEPVVRSMAGLAAMGIEIVGGGDDG
jgi:hypothetical protein